jgi:tetrahydromethanopterin S-methyltransferase subunit C
MIRFFSGLGLGALAFSLLVAVSYLDTPSWTTWQQVLYGAMMISIIVFGGYLITYLTDDQEDEVDEIPARVAEYVASVHWPRWSTLVLLGLAALFGSWSYGWTSYNSFNGVVAAMLFLTASVSILHHAAKEARKKRALRRLENRRNERKLPWPNADDLANKARDAGDPREPLPWVP